MRILAVNQFYAPDSAATAQLLTQLCGDLARAGDEVTVVASRGAYLGGGRLPEREHIDGVLVVRPWSTRLGKKSHLHRISDYLSFWATSVLQLARETRPDVILALTTPPMIAAGAGVVAAARKIPLVTWVQDVYPEVAIELGALGRGHPFVTALQAVARATHQLTHTTVVLSERMAERLEDQGQRRDRIRVIPNWSDGTVVRPIAHEDNPFRRAQTLRDAFVVMYSGNLGQGHDLTALVEAARLLAVSHPDIAFLFIGEGVRKAAAQRHAAGLANVRFLPYQPFDQLAESLSAGDVHLVSLGERLDGLVVPSKLYGILAAGRPVMYLGPASGEVARVIREHDVGWAGTPGDAAGLARAIAAAAEDRATTRRRGEAARDVFDKHFDRSLAVARWREALLEATGKKRE